MKKNLLTGLLTIAYVAAFLGPAFAYADERRQSSRPHADRQLPSRTLNRPRPHFDPIGRRVRELPRRRRPVVVRDRRYYYHRGMYYRPRPPGYVVVRAPIGARVGVMPPGYISFLIGPRHYFYANLTYYLWEPRRREYVVVEKPEGIENSQPVTSEFFVYPKQGQSDEQLERDRYDCHLWGVKQTGFDPSAPTQDTNKATDYRRALSACLDARGYTVK